MLILILILSIITDTDIANAFAAHFKSVFHSSHDDEAYNEFIQKRADCIKIDSQSCYDCVDKITVELIDNCVKKLKVSKVCGPDDLCTEHIVCTSSFNYASANFV